MGLLLPTICYTQPHFSVIGSTYVEYATAYSNGHKIVGTEWIHEESLYVVYGYDDSTCHFAYSYDRGSTWQSRELFGTLWGNSRFPSLDIHESMPYVVSQGDSGDRSDIFLKCPLDYCLPQRLSYTEGHSTLPAIVIDSSGAMHVVWQDDTEGNWEIYYCCAEYCTSVGEVVNLSDHSDASDTYSSIGIYHGDEVHVVWERCDTLVDCPYSIVNRYLVDGVWSDERLLAECTGIPLHHPSLDFSHGEDLLSAAWEDSSLGTSDAYFYGGNGGGFLTSGDSRYPVISTMGTVWSYLYWEDDSDGRDDIYFHQYYMGTDWTQYSLRDWYEDEEMHYPNVANGYMVFTHGESPPWEVVFHHYGYPIGVEEALSRLPAILRFEACPSAFDNGWDIRYILGESARVSLMIYDTAGRLISTLVDCESLAGDHVAHWNATDDSGRRVPSGSYFLRLEAHADLGIQEFRATRKLVVVK